jgi:hypothetical protein
LCSFHSSEQTRINSNRDPIPSEELLAWEVFYSTQCDLYDRLKKDLYVIEKDLYVRIRRLRLILHDWFFSCHTVVFKGRMGSIRVLSKNVKWYCCNIGNVIYEMF